MAKKLSLDVQKLYMRNNMSSYTPQSPEADEDLQAKPHYWLYKATAEAFKNKEHPLYNMGHIWNRWACEGLSIEDRQEWEITEDKYPVLSEDEKKRL